MSGTVPPSNLSPNPVAGARPAPPTLLNAAGLGPTAVDTKDSVLLSDRENRVQELTEKAEHVVNEKAFTVFDKSTEARDAAEFVGRAAKLADQGAEGAGLLARLGKVGGVVGNVSSGTIEATGKFAALAKPLARGLSVLSKAAPGISVLIAGADGVRAARTEDPAEKQKAIGVAGLSTLSAGLALGGLAFPPLFLVAGAVGLTQIIDDRTGNHLSNFVGKGIKKLFGW